MEESVRIIREKPIRGALTERNRRSPEGATSFGEPQLDYNVQQLATQTIDIGALNKLGCLQLTLTGERKDDAKGKISIPSRSIYFKLSEQCLGDGRAIFKMNSSPHERLLSRDVGKDKKVKQMISYSIQECAAIEAKELNKHNLTVVTNTVLNGCRIRQQMQKIQTGLIVILPGTKIYDTTGQLLVRFDGELKSSEFSTIEPNTNLNESPIILGLPQK